MKLIKVRCPKNKKVEVEELPARAARCPAHCPLKQKNKCMSDTFRYAAVLSSSVVPDIPYMAPDGASSSTVTSAAPTAPTSPAASARPALSSARTGGQTGTSGRGATLPKRADRFAKKLSVPETTEETSAPGMGYRESLFVPPTELAAPDVIEMEDVFGEDEPSEAPAAEQSVAPTKNKTLEKYNDALLEADSIFSGVRHRRPDEPCFEDGALVFYEGSSGVRRSAGNSQAALRHIFNHWYVSRVFCEDERTLREDFLGLLKLRGFGSAEEQIRAIVEDATLDVNHKFFRLFNQVIYKNRINGFYWHEGDSPLRRIVPRLLNVSDFYDRLASAADPTAFLSGFDSCMDELITFLRGGESGADNREWFMNTVPRLVAEKQNRACCVRQRIGGGMELINLGSIREFVSTMPSPAPLARLEERIAFLERFEVTESYRVRLRTEPLQISQRQGMEDDSVYDAVGLTRFETSQCATAYNKYVTLLKEYIRVFRPETLTVGAYRFTARSFYTEVMDVIAIAGAHLSEADAADSADSIGFYLVKSLFARGVFDYYEMLCETEKLETLKRSFLEHDRINLEMYFALDHIVHTVYINGEQMTVSDYIADRIGEDPWGDVRRLKSYLEGDDPVLQAYFRARITPGDERDAFGKIEKLINESAKSAVV